MKIDRRAERGRTWETMKSKKFVVVRLVVFSFFCVFPPTFSYPASFFFCLLVLLLFLLWFLLACVPYLPPFIIIIVSLSLNAF